MKRKLISGLFICAAILIYAVASCRGWIPEPVANSFARIATLFCLLMSYIELAEASSAADSMSELPIFKNGCEVLNILMALFLGVFENAIIISAAGVTYLSKNLLNFRDFLFVIVVCGSTDFGAGIFGRIFGRHKLRIVSLISPGKTTEGFIGGFVFSLITSVLITPLFYNYPMHLVLKLSMIMSVFAIIGDMLASFCKRCFCIKDSGERLVEKPILKIIELPLISQGGYLDRMDSMMFGIIVVALFKGCL